MPPPGTYIVLSQRLYEEQGQHVGICDELGLATCGKDFAEAKRRLTNAIFLVLNKALERGEIDALLEEKGIEIQTAPQKQIMTFRQVSLRAHEWLTPSFFPLGEALGNPERVPV